MYKAVGNKTNTVYAYADTKSQLMRLLEKDFKYTFSKEKIYPEPLRIETTNIRVSNLQTLSRREKRKIIFANVENEQIAKLLRTSSEEKEIGIGNNNPRRHKIKVTSVEGVVNIYTSIAETSRMKNISATTVRYHLEKGSTDKQGNRYEKVERND